MVEPDNKLVSRCDAGVGLTMEHRMKALSELGLLEAQTIPVFEEATQTAAHLLEVPICILGFLERHRYWFKSAVGLSRLGLMNQLAKRKQTKCFMRWAMLLFTLSGHIIAEVGFNSPQENKDTKCL